jgi:hypothetical protein
MTKFRSSLNLSARERNIEIVLETRDRRNLIPIEDAAEFFTHLQTLVNHIGDFLTGSDFRSRGRSPDYVRSRCALVFKSVAIGSFRAELALEAVEEQMTLIEAPTLGEASIKVTSELIQVVARGENLQTTLEQRVDEPAHRNRIIEDMFKIWPEERGAYRAKIQRVGHESMIDLIPERKMALKGLLATVGTKETTVRGILSMVQVPPKPELLRITGPDGEITSSFTSTMIQDATRLLGRPVFVTGNATFDSDGDVKGFDDIKEIKEFNFLTLQRVLTQSQDFALSQPLIVSVSFHDYSWEMKNEELGIVVADEDYDKTQEKFQEVFGFLMSEYAVAKDEELTQDAKILKSRLLSYVPIRETSV